MIRGLTSNASRQAFHRAGAVQWASLASRTREVARWAVDVIAGVGLGAGRRGAIGVGEYGESKHLVALWAFYRLISS